MFLESESSGIEKVEIAERIASAADETKQENLAASATGEESVTFDEAEPATSVIVVPPPNESSQSPEADSSAIPSADGMIASGSAAAEHTVTVVQIPSHDIETLAEQEGNREDEETVTKSDNKVVAASEREESDEIPAPDAASAGGNGEEEPPAKPPTGGNENNEGEDDDPEKRAEQKPVKKTPAAETSNEPVEEAAPRPKEPNEESLSPRPKKKITDLPSRDQQELTRVSRTPITERPVATNDIEEEGTTEPAATAEGEGELDIRVLELPGCELQYLRTTTSQGETAWVMNINVPDHLQGFGIGTRLLKDLAARCAAEDIRYIASLTVSESGLRNALRVFGEETTEFYDPAAAQANHDGWEGRKDVLPMTPAQASDSIKLGRERANAAWMVEGGRADNGVLMRTDVQRYFAAKAAAEAHPEEGKP